MDSNEKNRCCWILVVDGLPDRGTLRSVAETVVAIDRFDVQWLAYVQGDPGHEEWIHVVDEKRLYHIVAWLRYPAFGTTCHRWSELEC